MNEQKDTVSIIVPCYNEEATIRAFYEEVVLVMKQCRSDYELLFVDDGSKDRTLQTAIELSENDERVSYLSLSRNFGKESAMYAGLCNANGDYVVIIDADLQHPPSMILDMYDVLKHDESYDGVAAKRVTRDGDPWLRTWFSRRFYKLFNRFSDIDVQDGSGDFRMMRRGMVEAVIAMDEYNRFSKGILSWIGFNTCWLSFENKDRVAGESKWSFWKLLRYAIDGITSFSQAPLYAASWLGIGLTVLSVMAIAFIVIRKLMFGDPVAGWASTICVIIFIGGIQLCVLGIIGQYLAKTYMETKGRPHYVVSRSNRDNVIRIK
ncbi:MAG: glycosyltransferase family 2 protein [Bacillota bacterium]|nr:glycosyltransferase family 2 protein [Bacillota bacterium]